MSLLRGLVKRREMRYHGAKGGMAVRYLADENLTIRDMEPADVLPLCEEERAQGWRNA